MLLTTNARLTAEPPPRVPAGAMGVRWDGTAGDGSGRVPTQAEIAENIAAIEKAAGYLLTPAQRAKVTALLTQFSGAQAGPTNAAGVANNTNTDWARESARDVAAEIGRNAEVGNVYADFWKKQMEMMNYNAA
jgi:hypothetical protein